MANTPSGIRLFRVYSPHASSFVVRVFAQDKTEAILTAKERSPRLARLNNVRAFSC